MLSLGKLAPGQQQYYLDTVARGAEEYYTGAKEAPGAVGRRRRRPARAWPARSTPRPWAGSSSTWIPAACYRLTGVAVGADGRRVRRDVLRAEVGVACCSPSGHRRCPTRSATPPTPRSPASLGVLERAACRVRRGQGGHTVLDGDGFVAAAFRHRTSRAGDPHLHTHVVIANLAHAPSDDRWTALDGRPLYSWCRRSGTSTRPSCAGS